MSQSYFLAFCGGGITTLYSPVWAPTPGNTPASSFPSPVLLKLEGTALLHARSSSKRTLSLLDSLVYQATAGSPPPTRERGPRGQHLRGEKQRRRRGLKGTAPLTRASPSGGSHVAGSSGPRGGKSSPGLPVGPRRGWGEGNPALCLESPRLSSRSHPPHQFVISLVRWRGASARPCQHPPQLGAHNGARGPQPLPASPGAQSILAPATHAQD